VATPRRAGRGSVTAELALALPVVVLALSVLIGVGRVVAAELQCIDAARAGARWAARGESGGAIAEVARQFGPQGAQVVVSGGGRTVEVVVSATVRLPGTGWPTLRVSGHAVGEVEQP
jgi:hypothetical protein